MTWEKELVEEVRHYFFRDSEYEVEEVEWVLKILAKQRKELLDEVKEKVIGQREELYSGNINSHVQRNELRKEQLKKLEELKEDR